MLAGPAVGHRTAEDVLVFPFQEVDRGDRLAGQLVTDSDFGVREPDERPQQRWGQREVACVGDDLARNPVAEQDFHLHGAPPERIAGTVIGCVPEQRIEQFFSVRVVQPGAVRGGKEFLGKFGR